MSHAVLKLQPEVPIEEGQPRPLPPKQRKWTPWWIAVVVGVVLIAATALAVHARNAAAKTRAAATSAIQTAVVQRRDFVRVVRLHGKVEATQAFIVAAPSLTGGGFNTLVITHMIKAGTAVHKGDLLVEFDRQDQEKNALDKEAEYRDYEAQIAKMKADQAAARAKDDTELKQAADALESAQWETHKNEIVSRIDAEKNQQALEEAKAKLAQLRETYDLKRRSAQADVRILEIERDRAKSAMLHARLNAAQLSIHSPIDGVVVLNTIWKNGTMGEVQEGDEVRAGIPFMQVMSPGAMQVRAQVNQADVGVIRGGDSVSIHLDAYPGLTLPGRVQRVSAIAGTSSFSNTVRRFTALISIEGTDSRLIPDLSAAVDVTTETRPNVLVVPRDAIVEDGKDTYVMRPTGAASSRQDVKVADTSDMDAVIESGLAQGDTVIRSPHVETN